MTDPIHLTKTLIGIDSCNPGACEGTLGDYIYARLTERGIPVIRQPVLAGRFNVIAEIKGETQLSPLVLICHMDTVVAGDGWTMEPIKPTVRDGRIYGRGACDMKAGLACALSILEEIWENGKRPKRTLRLIATVDEEGEMNGIQAVLRENLLTPDSLIMDLEPTGLALCVTHKGRIWYEVQAKGKTAHASTPQLGVDAIAAMADYICRIRRLITAMPPHPEMGTNSVTFGQIQGGYQPYVVPDACTVTMDIRPVAPYSGQDIEEMMERAGQETEREFSGVVISRRLTGSRPFVMGDRQSELCAALSEAYEEICGQPVRTELFPGYTDTAVAAATLHSVNSVSFGPGSLAQAHKPDEFVPEEEVRLCRRIVGRAVQSLCCM